MYDYPIMDYSLVRLFSQMNLLYRPLMKGTFTISSRRMMMKTAITDQSNTKQLSKARGMAKVSSYLLNAFFLVKFIVNRSYR